MQVLEVGEICQGLTLVVTPHVDYFHTTNRLGLKFKSKVNGKGIRLLLLLVIVLGLDKR